MIKISKICIMIFIFNCAYQGSPGGGPIDDEGPVLLSVFPINESFLNSSDQIVIEFNEYINPKSLVQSINVIPEVNISYKVKGKKIFINPEFGWPVNQPIEVNLNRSITDFQSNVISDNIQLIYNIENNHCSISGYLENSIKNKLYNIFIYSWPLNILEPPIKQVNANNENYFNIKYLKPGKYIIIASEGSLNINNYRYGLIAEEYIEVNNQNKDRNIVLYIDEPIHEARITRVETINSQLLNIFYDDNTIDPYIFNANVGDSIYINIKKQNRLFEYDLEPYLYIVKDKVDSIPPYIHSIESSISNIMFNFSEPINREGILIERDSLDSWVKLEYQLISPMQLELLDSSSTKIRILGQSVEDLYKNKMLDSVKVYDLNRTFKDNGTSSLSGNVIGNKEKDIIVEAKNLSLNLLYHNEVKDSLFIFENLQPGQYVLRAYENKNQVNPLIFFSGILEPYQRAASFSIYRDTIEVRKFWDIKGINIEF